MACAVNVRALAAGTLLLSVRQPSLQSKPTSLLMWPMPLPAFWNTTMRHLSKSATTLCAPSMLTLQVLAVPEQAPRQPAKKERESSDVGCAVKVTWVSAA